MTPEKPDFLRFFISLSVGRNTSAKKTAISFLDDLILQRVLI